MTRVDFYILDSSDDHSRNLLACKLTEKAYRSGIPTFVRAASAEHAGRLDDLLWTFRQGAFIPHSLAGAEDAEETPIVIGSKFPSFGEPSALLINVANHMPDPVTAFERIIEVVNNEPVCRNAGRDRYRLYKEQGITPTVHQQGQRPVEDE
jgi:DNA polymerase-3 subunit chi